MSACKEGKFTCNDGQCVSMEERCNQLLECRDGSDEDNCNVVVLSKSYNKNVPPITRKNEKANVSISLDILKLVDIKEDDYSIEILAHRMPYFSVLGILKYGIGWRPQNAPFENCSI